MNLADETLPRRLNWGCGTWPEDGWLNSDLKEAPGIHIACDIREGLPLEDASIEYAVSIHALPELPLEDQVPAVRELRRVLAPGGALRLVLPNLLKGVEAYQRGDHDYFLVPDEDAESLGAKLVYQLVWYGYTKTPFVPEFAEEVLRRAGFEDVRHAAYGETTTPFPGIVELDNREAESLYVEAVK